MAFLKKCWPYSFTVEKKNVVSLVVNILVQLIAAVVAGLLIWVAGMITGGIPVLGWIIGILLGAVGTIIDLYCLIGIVVSVLNFCDVLKD